MVRRKQKNNADEESDNYEFDEQLEGFDETEAVERRFNFVSELAYLIDYHVLDKFLILLKDERHFEKRPALLKATTSFFKRILQQAK